MSGEEIAVVHLESVESKVKDLRSSLIGRVGVQGMKLQLVTPGGKILEGADDALPLKELLNASGE